MEYKRRTSNQFDYQTSVGTYNFGAYQGISDTDYHTSLNQQTYFASDQYASGTGNYQATTSLYPTSVFYQNTETSMEGQQCYDPYGATGSSEYITPNQSYYIKSDNSNPYDYTANNNHTEVTIPKQTYPATGVITIPDQANQVTNNLSNDPSSYATFGQFRQFYASRQQKPQLPERGNQPAPLLFLGKDTSYPDELNNLMNPFFCALCNSRLNSIKSANIHYESKTHDRHITAWLKNTYIDKGLEAPKLQRFVTETANEAVGVYHCEICKLELSSAQHALQHYNGKRHRLKISKISPATGIGYFDVEGKWVQTGKVIDKETGKETSYILVKTATGSEPVVLQQAPVAPKQIDESGKSERNENSETQESPAKKPRIEEASSNSKNNTDKKLTKQVVGNHSQQQKQPVSSLQVTLPQVAVIAASSISDATSNNKYETLSLHSLESPQRLQTPQEALESLECKVCSIFTTSKDQMWPHLKGARHSKKLKALGEPPISSMFLSPPPSILDSLDTNDPSDISMYRTPSGSYYCKLCNATVSEVALMKQHILSKKHLVALKNMTPAELSTLAPKH